MADKGVAEAGFDTTVQPAAIAGAIFLVIIDSGKFQGVIAAHTPTGSFNTNNCFSSCEAGRTSPYTRLASSIYQSTKSIPSLTSIRASVIGFPFSLVIKTASSSLISFKREDTFFKYFIRTSAVVFFQYL